ncbi:MAG: DUF3108 domain-containing protein [Telluria sp.]
MLKASVRTWHGRLLVAGAISLLVHVLAGVIVGHVGAPAAQIAPDRLVLRLDPARRAGPGKAEDVAASAARPPEPTPKAAPALPVPHTARPSQLGARPAPPPDTSIPGLASGPDDSNDAPGMPGRYRVRMPPPASLNYSVTTSRPRKTDGSAHIVWQNDGDRYHLSMDGPLGTLASSGHGGDAGIVPVEAREQRAGAEAVTRFDESTGHIVFSANARSYPINVGSQDRASVLMQLAGMGLAEPAQFSNRLEIFVAGADDAAVARYQVVGQESVATGVGLLTAWHLAQLVAPGQRRLELWLAPERDWYPVQLRLTDPDGTVTTQVLQAIDPAPPG